MITEDVDWVLLPRGRKPDGRLKFALFVAPRLGLRDEPGGDRTLGDYPNWLDWPATLQALDLAVDTGTGQPAAPVTFVSSPSSEWWTAMFPPKTRVEPFLHEHLEPVEVATYDAAVIADDLLAGYSILATEPSDMVTPWEETFWDSNVWSPAQPPNVDADARSGPRVSEVWNIASQVVGPANAAFGWSGGGEELFLAANASSMQTASDLVARATAAPDDVDVLTEWVRFSATNELNRIRSDEALRNLAGAGATPRERIARKFDFHRIVAATGEQPTLMRLLGLVIDLECDAAAVEGGEAAPTTISIVVRGRTKPSSVTDHLLATAVENVDGDLTVRSRDGARSGLLPAGEKCRIALFDFEAAGSLLLQLADEEVRTNVARGAKAPALRTTGLRVLQRAAAAELAAPAMINAGAGDNTGMVLLAEDVRRGSRIDVLDESTGRWRSVHQRRVRYLLNSGPTAAPVLDEGFIHLTMTRRTALDGLQPDPGSPVVVSDAIATWDGWSLSSPRPGRVVSKDLVGTGVPGDQEDADDQPPGDVRDLTAGFGERTGKSPMVRVENEALTSCGLSIVTQAAPGSLPRLRFGRAYRIRMRSVDLAGGGLTVDDADAVTAPETLDRIATASVVFRRFEPVPPPIVTHTAEQDPDDGIDRQGETERRIVVRSGLFHDEDTFGADPAASERLLVPPSCAVATAEWHGVFDAAIGAGAEPEARRKTYELASRAPGAALAGVEQTPHLTDPASAGVTLWEVPGVAPGAVVQADWPRDEMGRPRPLRLRLEAVPPGTVRPPALSTDGETVTVYLPPAERASMQVASKLAELDVMALPQVWRDHLDPTAAADAVEAAARGTHPHITPPVTVEMVHAVPRPLTEPVAGDGPVLAPRSKGATWVTISRPWLVHAASTGSVQLVATWSRPRDDPSTPPSSSVAPHIETVTTTVGAPTAVQPSADPAIGVVAIVVAATRGGGATPATLELGFPGRVLLRVRAVATSRFAAFFPQSYATPDAEGMSRLTAASGWLDVDVPNAERPPPPVIAEVLPLVVRRWEENPVPHMDHEWIVDPETGLGWSGDPVEVLREDRYIREGGWIRVWLERPWFVTGNAEHVAIVATDGPQPDGPADPRHRYCSLVGPDPGRGQRLLQPATAAVYGWWPDSWVPFRSPHLVGVGDDAGLHLSDRMVLYDQERQQWYVDVQVDLPGQYFPFVRLALLRDQPGSIPTPSGGFEVRCSEVVTLDPVPLLPRRVLTVRQLADGITVRLEGPVGEGVAWSSGERVDFAGWGVESWMLNRGSIAVQRRVREGDDSLAWEGVTSATFTAAPGSLAVDHFFAYDDSAPPGTYRLSVSEVEEHAWHYQGSSSRTVYVESVPLPRAVH